jgi:hypothetical protein
MKTGSLRGILTRRKKRKQKSTSVDKCVHHFEMKEVINLAIDPKCFFCGRNLSEFRNFEETDEK